WSISEMRRTRWEALGAPAELKPREEDITASELDEDAGPVDDEAEAIAGTVEVVRPVHKTTETEAAEDDWSGAPVDESEPLRGSGEHHALVRTFAHLASLPADVSEAFESFKLSILRHKLAGWTELAREDLLAALDALKELALAPVSV